MIKTILLCFLLVLLSGCKKEQERVVLNFEPIQVIKQYANGMQKVKIDGHYYYLTYYYGFHDESCSCKNKVEELDHGNIERDRKNSN